MRESNFVFPSQNRASVCITSQLYDRKALDTTASLPLFNTLSHLTYLTSTSPRIREIMTMDGGLERLVRILYDFCISPPPPENPALMFGLSPPNARPTKRIPTLNPSSYDKQAAYRFSLALQSLVNIGVRGSEPIRSRVVQAGTLDVIGCILEAWLVSKGFAVEPSTSATGIPRESREQRMARRQAHLEQRLREEQATRISRHEHQPTVASLEVYSESDDSTLDLSSTTSDTPSSATSVDTDTSTDTSSNTTPAGSNTPTEEIPPGRDRSGTIIGRPIWDQLASANRPRSLRGRQSQQGTTHSADTSRTETETEDDGDVDMDRSSDGNRPHRSHVQQRPLRTVLLEDTQAPALTVNADAHIIISDAQDQEGGVGRMGVDVGVGDGLVSLEPNDDFALGAPPGAPGAIEATPRTLRGRAAPDATPRARPTNLPLTATAAPGRVPAFSAAAAAMAAPRGTRNTNGGASGGSGRHGHGHHRDVGPYRDEDVLLGLQLLAYLSKYPHVRQAFYKPRKTFHPASANLPGPSTAGPSSAPSSSSSSTGKASVSSKDSLGFLRAFTSGSNRGKEKEKAPEPASPALQSPGPPRETNVFSLVERFTFKPSSTETDLPNPPPPLPTEIQYWAGVIMRNACRKDDSRGGIRQCARMLCGRWETYPREFAKCRRCRKAKYCGKACQSTAWSEGHRFWCSVKDEDDDHEPEERNPGSTEGITDISDVDEAGPDVAVAGMDSRGERERRYERERRLAGLGQAPLQAGADATEVPRNFTAGPTQGEAIRNANNGEPLYVVTGQVAGRAPIARPVNAPAGGPVGYAVYTPQEAGRRRAGTVIGAPVDVSRQNSGRQFVHPPPPAPHIAWNAERINVQGDAGPSRRSRLHDDDHDMVLG